MISEGDIEKAVKIDMESFTEVETAYPPLGRYRKKVIDQFKKHYKAINDLVINLHDGRLYFHNLVINGAISRSLNFYRGAIWGLGTRNSHVFYDSLRGQCETLGLIHYCVLNPAYIEAAAIGAKKHKTTSLKIVNILTMIDKLDKKYKGIRKDYDELCELVHPNPASLYANIKPEKEQENGTLEVSFGSRSPRFTDEVAKEYLTFLIVWTDWIFKELFELAGLLREVR